MKNITRICFPNTVDDQGKTCYEVGRFGVEKINTIQKNGEMASIGWIQVIKGGKIIAEIKESVCDIYGSDELPNL